MYTSNAMHEVMESWTETDVFPPLGIYQPRQIYNQLCISSQSTLKEACCRSMLFAFQNRLFDF